MDVVNLGNPDGCIYTTSLNFTDSTLKYIIQDIRKLEQVKEAHGESRTFKLSTGFHSNNLLGNPLLENYFYLKLAVSRIQELVYNHCICSQTNLDFINVPGALRIQEIWVNILRNGDYNIPHNHPNNTISGNFYLNDLKNTKHQSDGSLVFIKDNDYNDVGPWNKTEGVAKTIHPKKNLGVLFRSWKKHVVMPHFSEEDRVGLAFNAVYDPMWTYQTITPKPFWFPIKLKHDISKDEEKNKQMCINLDFSSWEDKKLTPNIAKGNSSMSLNVNTQANIKAGTVVNIGKNIMNNLYTQYPIDFLKFFNQNNSSTQNTPNNSQSTTKQTSQQKDKNSS